MSFFAKQTKTIILDDENSITITKPSFGRRQEMLAPAMRFNAETNGIEPIPGIFQKQNICLWVTGWSGPGFDGLPCTSENVLQLDTDITDKILKEIDSFGGEVNDETKK